MSLHFECVVSDYHENDIALKKLHIKLNILTQWWVFSMMILICLSEILGHNWTNGLYWIQKLNLICDLHIKIIFVFAITNAE